MVVEVVISSPDDLERLKARLQDFSQVLESMGTTLNARSQAAFEDKQFGDAVWKPRYPGQKGPPLNLAGLISDLNAGKEPPMRRFQASPVGIDTGQLQGSITHTVDNSNFSVTAGSRAEHAQRFHAGGDFSMPVNPETVPRLRAFVESHPQYKKTLARFIGKNPPDEYASKMAGPRPFVGIIDKDQRDFIEIVEQYLGGNS